MTLEEVVDPRIAVLIVWAIFFCVFIILPSICIRCLGCCTPNPHNIDNDSNRGGEDIRHRHRDHEGAYDGWDRYMFLSVQKRQEIDELRSDVLRRYLVRFSMVLERGHMMCLSESGGEEGDFDSSCGELANKEGLISGNGVSCLGEHDDVECQIPIDRDMANPDDYINHNNGTASGSPKEKETGSTEEEAGLQEEKDFTVNSEDAASNKLESNNEQVGLIDIMAPAGKLHVLFDDTHRYCPLGLSISGPKAQVTEIREDSPLSGKIQVGDQLISIDDEDMTQMPGTAIYVLLFSKEDAERKITVFRGDYDNGEVWEEKKSSTDYTHVQIPFPGYDSHGKKAKEKKPIPEGTTKSHWRLFPTFFQTKVQVVDNQPKNQEKNQADDDDDDNDANVRSSTERRNVPAFCAICLGEYSPSEPISWASNPDCTHVFHQECIVKWLNTLGRKTSKYQRFSDDPPSVVQLLNYGLECPCCRQDFICKKLILEEEEVCGDEHV
mmetsp:Transcript_14562/g.26267  ORF Transcript_14562/g.26267 Transcript_14562/m.26267 type:complete len:495 (-) Transcript_14562:100-1584(-)|eukprot:CAMPEP_0201895248 /NCGR_PEP_ID=MMETSP0902-20130614/42284_1 /ASSEMBLY_ACC=CAM_ASM_000551 /TAXON_ID=420261 /ORGANISM="Thalassiosira antarctica, Strain CCMP982" /LENGTH=494 /DNA_ID=CAMNT_0048427523 /DNA_START=224 /DNA_END=1708 /DNA_ORIENTATION=-